MPRGGGVWGRCRLRFDLTSPHVQHILHLVHPPLLAVGHDIDPAARSGVHGLEHAKPIVIGDDVWIGGGAIVMCVRIGRADSSVAS